MAVTYEQIASQTLGSAASSVTFSDISGKWTDLVCVVTGTTSGNGYQPAIRLNSDTGTNYSRTFLYGDGSSALSANTPSNPTYFAASTGTGGPRFMSITHIMSYSNTNVYKTMLSSNSTPSANVARFVGLWRSTSAVTSVTFLPDYSVNFESGCTFALFGIKAA